MEVPEEAVNPIARVPVAEHIGEEAPSGEAPNAKAFQEDNVNDPESDDFKDDKKEEAEQPKEKPKKKKKVQENEKVTVPREKRRTLKSLTRDDIDRQIGFLLEAAGTYLGADQKFKDHSGELSTEVRKLFDRNGDTLIKYHLHSFEKFGPIRDWTGDANGDELSKDIYNLWNKNPREKKSVRPVSENSLLCGIPDVK